jgi:hypothetical protein
MLSLLLLTTALFYDVGVNLTPYMVLLPAECPIRIDIVSRNNIYFDAYAWYSGRIIIYDGNNLSYDRKKELLLHELGHVCSKDNLVGSYEFREITASRYVWNAS